MVSLRICITCYKYESDKCGIFLNFFCSAFGVQTSSVGFQLGDQICNYLQSVCHNTSAICDKLLIITNVLPSTYIEIPIEQKSPPLLTLQTEHQRSETETLPQLMTKNDSLTAE